MSKLSSILLLFIALPTFAIALDSFPKLVNVKNFDDYLKQTGKTYPNAKERELREALFRAKKTIMELINQQAAVGLSTFKLDLNALADMTHTEIAKMTGSKISYTGEELISRHTNYVTAKLNPNSLPNAFDWRQQGGVTPARFQGFDCGSCWSFATIGSLEGHVFRRTGQLVPLSEQNLVDCAEAYGSMGCEGGFQEYAFEYIRDNGVALAQQYPYIQMENPQCARNQTSNGVNIRDYVRIRPGDEEKMKEAIATLGPLACSMNANTITFAQYKDGIYDDDECNKEEVNHSVVVVGYGSENGKDYWIIKNSYSENWGDNGFMKLARNRNNFCGIASECSYPLL